MSEPKPNPKRISLDEWGEIQELVWNLLDRAIARWKETEAHADRARDLAELERRLDRWAEMVASIAGDARTELLRVILATSPEFDRRATYRPEKLPWPARGVMFGEKVYLAVPDPYQEGESNRDGPDKMMLVVMDRAAILDATGGLNLNLVSPEEG